MKRGISGTGFNASGAAVAITEQFFYTGTQFLLTLCMARVVTVQEFGFFALIGSFVTLSNVLHFCFVYEAALINDPATSVPKMLKPYLLTTAASALCLMGYFVVTGTSALAVSGSIFLLGHNTYWLLRSVAQVNRTFLLSLVYGVAVTAIYGACLLAGYKYHLPIGMLLLMMGTLKCLYAAGVLWTRRRQFGLQRRAVASDETVRSWYVFGAQSFIHQILVWSILNLPMLYLGYRGLLDQVGFIRILYTFLLPCQYVFMAVFNYYMPYFVKLSQAKDTGGMLKFYVRSSLFAGSLAFLYSFMLFFLGSRLSGLIFGIRYKGIEFGLFALIPVLLSQISSTRTLLKASGRIRVTAIASLFGALVMLAWIGISRPTSYGFASVAVVAAYMVVLGIMMTETYREYFRPRQRAVCGQGELPRGGD